MDSDKNELSIRYTKLSNDRLLEMLRDQDEYTPEALAVLRTEIGKRQITAHEVVTFQADNEEKVLVASANALVPLRLWEKIFYFFLWFTPWFIMLAFGLNYQEDGFETKLRQSRFFRIAGFASIFLNFFITEEWLRLGSWAGWIVWFILFGISYLIAPLVTGTRKTPNFPMNQS